MLRFGLVLPRARGAAEVVIPQLLAAASTLALLRALTDGPIRWRLAWAGGGHRRASVYRIAEEVARRCPELENDPTASAWEVVVREDAGAVEVELEPSALEDPRFSWRRTDVAAASHPTLAAALARLAGVRARDVVWDPFVGSGSELIERARLGPYAALIGSDLDPRALVAARENLAAAGVAATLDVADACAHAPAGVTLIITNPPMGRRVHRGDIGPLLDAFVDHVARVLVPGGRMAWLSPVPRRTRERALLVGLRFSVAHRVDMGGFDAEFQLLEKPVRPGTR
ncbi:MAG: hypothetical protein EXR73_07650 [Myxococcales bacterium]|nr:hypothetical protein [Myxococcales bacterium]